MHWLIRLRRGYLWQVAILIVCLIMVSSYMFSYVAINNLVWVAVLWHSFGSEPPFESVIQVENTPLIAEAGRFDPRISMGLGVLAALRGDEATALAMWHQGRISINYWLWRRDLKHKGYLI